MGKYILCNICGKEYLVGANEVNIICPVCGCKQPVGYEDWREAYFEEVHKQLLKPGGGEKADRTHSRQRLMKVKIAKANREWRYRIEK